jgi:hypothetical protein
MVRENIEADGRQKKHSEIEIIEKTCGISSQN